VLPGFPTSAIFTFHAFVAPVIRALAGLPPEATRTLEAEVPVRIPSEFGRQEFVLVALAAGESGPVAFPTQKGSGAVTSFSQADGFLEIDALVHSLDAGTRTRVTLIGESAAMPDLVIMAAIASRSTRCSARLPSAASRPAPSRSQPGRRHGGNARRMRLGATTWSIRQRASTTRTCFARPRAGERLAADAGPGLSRGRHALCRA